jgi:hypothetical protein
MTGRLPAGANGGSEAESRARGNNAGPLGKLLATRLLCGLSGAKHHRRLRATTPDFHPPGRPRRDIDDSYELLMRQVRRSAGSTAGNKRVAQRRRVMNQAHPAGPRQRRPAAGAALHRAGVTLEAADDLFLRQAFFGAAFAGCCRAPTWGLVSYQVCAGQWKAAADADWAVPVMVLTKKVAAHTRLSPHRRLIEICAQGPVCWDARQRRTEVSLICAPGGTPAGGRASRAGAGIRVFSVPRDCYMVAALRGQWTHSWSMSTGR